MLLLTLVLHDFADGAVVWLTRGEVKLHAEIVTPICGMTRV